MKYGSIGARALGVLLVAAPFTAACSSTSDSAGGSGGSNTSGAANVSGSANVAGSSSAAGAPSAGAPAGGATAGGGSGAGAAGSAGASGGSTGAAGAAGAAGVSGSAGSSSSGLALTSPDLADDAKFGSAFTCAAMNGTFGAGVSPELDWTGAPANTQSFAITFIDTKIGESNAMGQHWAAWDIPATAKQLPRATTALSGPLMGSKQTNKYLAPCPSGDDTYEFTLYALSTATLSVSGAEGNGTANSAGVAKVLAALHALTPLATTKLHGTSGAMGK